MNVPPIPNGIRRVCQPHAENWGVRTYKRL